MSNLLNKEAIFWFMCSNKVTTTLGILWNNWDFSIRSHLNTADFTQQIFKAIDVVVFSDVINQPLTQHLTLKHKTKWKSLSKRWPVRSADERKDGYFSLTESTSFSLIERLSFKNLIRRVQHSRQKEASNTTTINIDIKGVWSNTSRHCMFEGQYHFNIPKLLLNHLTHKQRRYIRFHSRNGHTFKFKDENRTRPLLLLLLLL